MHMDMVIQLLVPGMEHLEDAGLRAQVFPVGSQLKKGFGTALMEQPIKKLLVTVNQRIQLVWESKNHMKVR